MKYSPENYAIALTAELKKVSSADHDKLVKNFVAQIYRHGDFPALDKIEKAVEAELAKAAGGKVVEVEFAREVDKKSAELLTGKFTKNDVVKFRTNPSLVAGVRITVDGEKELDGSLRGKLNKIFR
jgi:F0F1-type ATP synthase delta subunit